MVTEVISNRGIVWRREWYANLSFPKTQITHYYAREVKILMRLPDGNISAAHPSVLYS
jgi:hypothetical protein